MRLLRISEADVADAIAAQKRQFSAGILQSQMERSKASFIGGLIVAAAIWTWPGIFPYTYFAAPHFFTDLLRFWPALVACILLNILPIATMPALRARDDEGLLLGDIVTAVGAGVTEELWFRCIGAFFYMLLVMGLNWLMAHFPGQVEGVAGTLTAFFLLTMLYPTRIVIELQIGRGLEIGFSPLSRFIFAFASALACIAPIFFHVNPLYEMTTQWFYPIIVFVSTLGGLTHLIGFNGMADVLPGVHPPLLVMGLIFANFQFRDGHKYQGPLGWTSAWWMGCVFLYATLSYGLPVAVAIHAIFDASVGLMQYIGQKLLPEPSVRKETVYVDS